MKMFNMKRDGVFGIGFIDPNTIWDKTVILHKDETEENLYMFLKVLNTQAEIVFPYNFKWVLLSSAYSVSLISLGYGNVIDDLCMHAQLPLYSPRD